LYIGIDVFVIYPSYNNSKRIATKSGRSMKAVYDTYFVINSQNFICTLWFYSHREASVHGREIFEIDIQKH